MRSKAAKIAAAQAAVASTYDRQAYKTAPTSRNMASINPGQNQSSGSGYMGVAELGSKGGVPSTSKVNAYANMAQQSHSTTGTQQGIRATARPLSVP